MSLAPTPFRHPVLVCVEAMAAALDSLSEVSPVFMTTDAKAEALTSLWQLEARVVELRMRIMAEAGDVAEQHAARDVAAWLAAETHSEVRATRADLELAKALERHPHLRAALAAGRSDVAHARVIAQALDELPTQVGEAVRSKAEQVLVSYVADHRPQELRVMGRRILDIVAPEVGEAEEARLLAREEAAAERKTSLRFQELGDGTTRVTAVVPDAIARRLETYLQAFTSPRQPDAPTLGTPQHRRLGEAFCAFLERVDPRRLPLHGGDATTVFVTIGLDQLLADLHRAGVATLAGQPVTAAEARRLACTGSLVPVVLGGQGEVLDLGRSRRLFSGPVRKALAIRDKRCRADGCSIPAEWCEAHHTTPWSRGGRTSLADGLLLCAHHHHRAHDPRYSHDRLPNGDLRFHRRP